MNLNRKNFLKFAGLATAGMLTKPLQADKNSPFYNNHIQQFNMHGYGAPRLDKVRICFIGLGSRGSGTVGRFSEVEGVEIKALCDIYPERIEKAKSRIKGSHNPDSYSGTEDAWEQLCERDDIDLVVISTPWSWHAQQAVYTMKNGKHAAVEVPAAKTIEECWQLVETSEKTKKHCIMLANSAYGDFNILTLNMARQGFFGEIIHGEGAYIHEIGGSLFHRGNIEERWRLKENINRNGNLYPTHGLGTICQVMDLNYGDRMTSLVSMSGNDFSMADEAKRLASEDNYFKPYVGLNYRGNMNTSIIRTYKGKTIMLQHDVSSPRPNVRFNLISGTKAIAQQTPAPAKISTSHEGWLSQEEFKQLEEKYTPEISKRIGDLSKQFGGHGGIDSMLAWRVIDCLRNGIPPDMDVYDAALWSSIAPLSEWSVANRSNSVEVPDFTSGSWKTNERGMDINLERGGNTNFIINT